MRFNQRSSARHPGGGRLQIGIGGRLGSEQVADFKSESVADLRRNPQLTQCGKLTDLTVEHFLEVSNIMLPVNAQLRKIRVSYVAPSTISQIPFFPGLSNIWIQGYELPADELDLSNVSELETLVISIPKQIRLRLPVSLKNLTIFGSARVSITNAANLVNMRNLSLRDLGALDHSDEVLTLPALSHVMLDDKTREAIGRIPSQWAKKQ